jgi:putative nucleotidyltransferase with HDIG domain
MAKAVRRRLSPETLAYVFVVSALGLVTVTHSVWNVSRGPLDWGWLKLCGLTLVCGWLSVKLPSGLATLSISETFVISGTVLYGPSSGVVLVVLDALVLCLKEGWNARQLRWQQVVFNAAAPAISIWLAAFVVGIKGGSGAEDLRVGLDFQFVVSLAEFTALYFSFNSSLISLAVALERKISPLGIWISNFKEIALNFFSSASIAAFVIHTKVDIPSIGIMLPLLVVIYFTYSWSNVRVQAERDKNDQLNRVFLSTVEALALAIDAKDQVTHGHIRRVQRHTMELAKALGVTDEKQLDAIRAAALLHDTGKLAVPEYILNKPGPLTASEFERMKVHAAVGADILKSIEFPYPVEPIVRYHHENWNGSGYPEGLKGDQIPLGARILSVVDCYDALTSDRPYRPRYTRKESEQILRERRGTMYDPWVVDGFLKLLDSLEESDSDERNQVASQPGPLQVRPAQLDVISATQAEEREFNELRRDLPRVTTMNAAAELLFRHVRRLVPAKCLALYVQKPNANEIAVAACSGVGAAALEGATIPIGDRISGWALAHRQVVVNSDASLDLGPVSKTFSIPLRYAIAVPIIDGPVIGVLTAYSSDPFEKDHCRILESAITLFSSSLNLPAGPDSRERSTGDPAQGDTAIKPKSRVH